MGKLELASILVGDHLGQVKKVIIPSGDVVNIPDCNTPDKNNPVVSIEPIHKQHKHLIANKKGELYIYDSILDSLEQCQEAGESLVKALPYAEEEVILIYDKHINFESSSYVLKQKRGSIKNAKINANKLAIVGEDIPLRVYDLETKKNIFDANPPDKNWLGIQPETYVANLDFVGSEGNHVATCSKSDSVIRLYDIRHANKTSKPMVSVNLDQEAFNEHATAGRFVSISSTGQPDNSTVVGSNVGQLIAIDFRLAVIKSDSDRSSKERRKKFKPRGYKVVGGFKGARGATIKDIQLVPSGTNTSKKDHKVISCCLDRYLRIHNYSKTDRSLDKQVYMKTKPMVCSPIFYERAFEQTEEEEDT